MIIITLCTCSSTPEKKKDIREKKILEYSEEVIDTSKYEVFLVDSSKYTTRGKVYHTKYLNYLVGIIQIITEKKALSIIEKSVGFYYDRKEDSKEKLFLGLDIKTSIDPSLTYSSYRDIALALLEKYLKDILYTIHSCKTIFSEKEIVGMVIGIFWTNQDIQEYVNIWIDKKDVIRYEQNMLTLNELIQRNTITNTEGKIISLEK